MLKTASFLPLSGSECPFYTKDGLGILESPNFPGEYPARHGKYTSKLVHVKAQRGAHPNLDPYQGWDS